VCSSDLLDLAAVKAAREQGDVVYAIPSPGRRDSNAWVLDEAPRLPAKSPTAQATLQAAGGG